MSEDNFHKVMVATGLISSKSGKYVDHALRGDLGQPLPTSECRVCGGKTDPYEDDYGICSSCFNSTEFIVQEAVQSLIKRDKAHGANY